MNNSSPLHWSYDYNHGAQNPEFAQELIKSLSEWTTIQGTKAGDEHSKKHIYQILPNFWRGYKRGDSLSIGNVIIERKKCKDDIWYYSVQYQNSTSGEDLRLNFCCRDEIYRPLWGNWKVDAQNSCDDAYSELSWTGHLAFDSEVRLCINNTEITAGNVDNSLPLTCNWALFDVIPALAGNGDCIDIALLDDLEQLRPKCNIGFLDSTQSPIPLDGYYLYGAGLLPSYWWVDANGNIAIVSTIFETLVLREMMGSP